MYYGAKGYTPLYLVISKTLRHVFLLSFVPLLSTSTATIILTSLLYSYCVVLADVLPDIKTRWIRVGVYCKVHSYYYIKVKLQ